MHKVRLVYGYPQRTVQEKEKIREENSAKAEALEVAREERHTAREAGKKTSSIPSSPPKKERLKSISLIGTFEIANLPIIGTAILQPSEKNPGKKELALSAKVIIKEIR